MTKNNELTHAAYAIVGDPDDPTTWQLPHHTINRNVNFILMDAAAASLSRKGFNGKRVSATPQQILDAARHLAAHYNSRKRTIPWGITHLL